MRARKIMVLFLSILGLLLATWIATGQQVRRIDDLALKNAGKTEDWLTYGLTPGEIRYSSLKQIDATNVSRLGLAWSYDLGAGGGNQEGTPLEWNGNIYGITNWSVVYSVDVRTGKERWRWDPEVNQTAVRPKICCGVVNRGLAIYNGLVIAPAIDGRLIALDAATGKPRWEARVGYPQDHYTVTMAPRIAKGKVIVGASGGDRPTRGFFVAFDAMTGREAWRFYTVPGDPSKPFENAAMKKAAATWDGEWWKLGGGGAVWDGFAYDADADMFRAVSKCGAGFTDADLVTLHTRLAPLVRPDKPARVDARQAPDVWCEPGLVLEILSAELTLSPNNTAAWGQIEPDNGLAMRFPRFTGRWRDDKAPEDATTTRELIDLYRAAQRKPAGT